MKTLLWIAAAPLLIAAGAPLDAETRSDVRCLVATSTLVGNSDKGIAIAGAMAGQYYLGRIDGRHPKIDLAAVLIAETNAMATTDMRPLFKSCGALMKQRGDTLIAIGKRMEADVPQPPSS